MNGLKAEFPEELRVLSVDVQSSFGRELTNEYGKFTPTFIFFDPQGEEVWRSVGTLDADDVRQLIK